MDLDIYCAVFVTVFTVVLFFTLNKMEEYKSTKWKLLFLVTPLVVMANGGMSGTALKWLGAYIGTVIMLVCFFVKRLKMRRLLTGISALFFAVSVALIALNIGDASTHYQNDFEKAFKTMKVHYALTEQKGIDWDELYEKYDGIFEDIDDGKYSYSTAEIANYAAWWDFTLEFNDGHVQFISENDINDDAFDEMFGNDYGLSMMGLSDGSYVAVNVDESLADIGEGNGHGIKNGTVITFWDGQSIEDIYETKVEHKIEAFPDEDNEKFCIGMTVAGIGGDAVTVTYLDEDGSEQTATLNKLGAYYTRRLKATEDLVNQGVDIGHLCWQEYGDDTALLRIKEMMYDTDSYEDGDHSQMTDEIRTQVLAYKEQGVKNLIVDLRSNGGGSAEMISGIIQLFAPTGEHTLMYGGVLNKSTATFDKKNGKYVVGDTLTYEGEDLWSDGNIYILVNYESASASDIFTAEMSKFDNVKVLGFTKSNGSGQGVGELGLDSGDLHYSQTVDLDENGDIWIDSGTDRVSQVPIDEIVPFDEDAVEAIFDNGEDYVLDCCLEECE